MRAVVFACAGLVTACAPTAGTMMHNSPDGAALVSTPILRTTRTTSGQPLRLPQGEAEMVATLVTIPAGGAMPIHQHLWSRFLYVEQGPVRIINHDTGQSHEFQTGQVIPEVVAQWHEGRALGPSAAKLIVIDLVPPGVNNTIMRQ